MEEAVKNNFYDLNGRQLKLPLSGKVVKEARAYLDDNNYPKLQLVFEDGTVLEVEATGQDGSMDVSVNGEMAIEGYW